MLAATLSVRTLLLAIFILMAGGGFMSTLVSLRLEAAGAPSLLIGLVATAYFGGLTVGSLRAPAVIRRVGHIRAFAAFVSLLSASTLAYAVFAHPAVWAGLRLVDGVCVAGVYVCLESWLNDRAPPAARGAVLAAYMVALYGGQGLGQHLVNLDAAGPATPFLAAAMLISLAVLPVALTRSASPSLADFATFPVRRLYAASPLGMVGVGVTGTVIGAFYGLGAVYARRLSLDLAGAASFMSAVILGGVVLQWPLGALSDRFDRRLVIVGALLGTLGVSLALAVLGAPGILLLVLGGLFGGLSFALYPLCVAHTNDHLTAAQRVGASGGLVLVYSAGAATGPLAAAAALALFGAGGLFLFIAACVGAAAAFALWRLQARGPVPEADQQAYQVLPRTTPMSAALDPFAPDRK